MKKNKGTDGWNRISTNEYIQTFFKKCKYNIISNVQIVTKLYIVLQQHNVYTLHAIRMILIKEFFFNKNECGIHFLNTLIE